MNDEQKRMRVIDLCEGAIASLSLYNIARRGKAEWMLTAERELREALQILETLKELTP